MADNDTSSSILRYNLVTTNVEYFNGADYYPVAAISGVVNSINTLTGDVVLAAGSNITLTPSGNTITIAAAGGGSGSPGGSNGDVQFNTSGSFGGASTTPGDIFLFDPTASGSNGGLSLQLGTTNGGGDEVGMRFLTDAPDFAQISFVGTDNTTLQGFIQHNHNNIMIQSREGNAGVEIQSASGTNTWDFQGDGALNLPNLGSRPSSPTEGDMIYNSNTHNMEYWNGSAWITL